MKTRPLWITAALLVSLLLVVLVVQSRWGTGRPNQGSSVPSEAPVLPSSLDLRQIRQVEISTGLETTTLRLREDGRWGVVQLGLFLANQRQLNQLLLDLHQLKHQHLVSREEALRSRYAVLGAAQHGRAEAGVTGNQLTLKNDSGEVLFDMVLGKNREQGGQYIWSHLGGIYLVADSVIMPPNPLLWIQNRLLPDLNVNTAARWMEVQVPGRAPLRVWRSQMDGPWSMEGRTEPPHKEEALQLAFDLSQLEVAGVAPAGADTDVLGMEDVVEAWLELDNGVVYHWRVGAVPGRINPLGMPNPGATPTEETPKVHYMTVVAQPAGGWPQAGDPPLALEIDQTIQSFNSAFGEQIIAIHDWDFARITVPGDAFYGEHNH